MSEASSQYVSEYWSRDGLEQAILNALVSEGHSLDALTIEDLAPFDQFHGGGKGTTLRLARLAELKPGMHVLDVGGGLGGPARTLAAEFGCDVTVLDITESYLKTGEALTKRLGLADRVKHRLGNALQLPFDDTSFDVVWTQNSGMNIAAKRQLYTSFWRVLRPGGVLAFQEPMAGSQTLVFPVMWADEASSSFLKSTDEMRDLIERAGFRLRAWQDITADIAGGGAVSRNSIQYLIMGERTDLILQNGRRNQEEGRVKYILAVFVRPELQLRA